jgi:hypothetical protein
MRRLLVGLGVLCSATVFSAGSAAHATAATGAKKPLSVCTDRNGTRRVADLDVVLLMDNSKSLETTKKGAKPTDPSGRRFTAVRDLLVSLEGLTKGTDGQKGVPINFGMISFGSRASVEIPIAPLEDANAVADEVKRTLPPLQQVTDYISALELAVAELTKRPAENCKFLIWFTDGQFESSEISRTDPERRTRIASQAAMLENKICAEGGLADQFHEARVNTFVLVLKPTNTDERLDVSYGAMQAITGAYGEDQVPSDVARGKRGDLCGDIAERDHLGDILVAEDASSIARKVPTIANSIDDWEPVTACPVSTDDEDMPKMPAARHLSKLSFTAYEKGTQLTSLDGATIVDSNGGSHPFATYMEKLSASEFEQKFRFNEAASTQLGQGWTFDIASGEAGWCVQMLPHRFEVEFTNDKIAPVREVSPGGLLTSADLDSLTYVTAEGSSLPSLADARSESSKVTALLDIDPTKKLFVKPLAVMVRQLTVPAVLCDRIALTADEPMPKQRAKAVSCDIDTSNTTLGTVRLSMVVGEQLETDGCSATFGLSVTPAGRQWKPGTSVLETLDHPKGAATFHVVMKSDSRQATCKSQEGNFVVIDYSQDGTDKAISVPVVVDVEWRKVPIAWVVALVTAIILALVILVNLLLMRVLARSSSLIPRFGIDAYEVPVLLVKEASGRVAVTQRDRTPVSQLVFDLGRKIVIDIAADRRSATLRTGSGSRLRVRIPPLHRPFGQSVLSIDSGRTARYWQAVAGGRGISPLARSGVILHSPQPSRDGVEAIGMVLMPTGGTDRQRLIREALGARLSSAIQDTVTDPDWFGGAGSVDTSAPGQRHQPNPMPGDAGDPRVDDDPRAEPPPPPPPPPRPR